MPYIKQQDRKKFTISSKELPSNQGIDTLEHIANVSENAGDLNFAITKILKQYIKKKGICYANHNEIIGMLDCCKAEWYRKEVVPYEDFKENENGSV
jgi:hypothetical protein